MTLDEKPVDLLLFCPRCGHQHVDEARPHVCETCGKGQNACGCVTFTAWLNPPHKSHRCEACNHVWRPADVPTNGVAAIQTKGKNDGTATPSNAINNDLLKACIRAFNLVSDEDNNKLIVEMPGSFGLWNDLSEAINNARGK
jgi:hypothetical protein